MESALWTQLGQWLGAWAVQMCITAKGNVDPEYLWAPNIPEQDCRLWTVIDFLKINN